MSARDRGGGGGAMTPPEPQGPRRTPPPNQPVSQLPTGSSPWPTTVITEFGFSSCETAFSLLKRVAPSFVNCPESIHLGRRRSQDTAEAHQDRENCRFPRVRPSPPRACISCPDLPGPSASPTPLAAPPASGPPCYPGGRSESER